MSDRRFRVLIIMSFAGFGGAQIAALRLARGLRDQGHDPKVLALYEPAEVDTPDHPYEVLLPAAEPGLLDYARIAWKLHGYIRREKPELVLTFLPLASILGQAAAWMAGVDKRIVSHRVPVNTTHPVLQRLDSLWARLGIYTGVVAVSEGVRVSCAHYPERLRERTVVIHNGIRGWQPSALTREQARQRFGVPDGTCLLVAVGRLAEQKNYPFMLRLLQRLDNVTLLIAGDGPLRGELDGLVAQLGIDGKARLLGAVARPDVPDLLAAADIFIQTSTFEGQSNSVLEALQTGVPIVANDIPEQRETIADPDGSAAGVLVPLEDLDAWVTAIETLRSDPGLAQAAREVAARRAKTFRYETMIAGFERVFAGEKP